MGGRRYRVLQQTSQGARVPMGKVVGVAMIVKNEEVLLGRCLDSVKSADEIVVCDTGSIDSTIDIAKQFTDKVFTDYQWRDSFCEARNHAKSKSTADWILSIDADEFCHDFSKVREAVELAQASLAIDCKLYAEDNRQMHYFPRLFKNSPAVSWDGAVHNHLNVLGEKVGDVRITYGYSPAHFLDRDRTMRILERETQTPGKLREMFYLGREYFYRNQYHECVNLLWQYTQDPNCRHLQEKAEAYMIMAKAARICGEMDAARDACMQALTLNAHFREAALFMAELAGDGAGNARWQANADQWKRLASTATN